MNKYRAIKVREDGYTFDSKLEYRRYCGLKFLLASGAISNLEIHPAYEIHINDIKICRVELDFKYQDKEGEWIYEDTKGVDTPVSRLKRKMLQAQYGISVKLFRGAQGKRRRT